MPSPVQISALVVGFQTWPLPPQARITDFASNSSIEPSATLRVTTPQHSPFSSIASAVREPLLVAGDRVGVLHQLLVEDVHDRLAGDVGDVVGAGGGGAAEGAGAELAFLVAVEGDAEVLEVEDLLRRLAGHDFDRVLVAEVVGALDRVEGVRLPGVAGVERGVDPALGGVGVRADRVDLADDPDRYAFLGGGEGGALAGEAGTDYENVMGWHERGCYRWRNPTPQSGFKLPADGRNPRWSRESAHRPQELGDPTYHGGMLGGGSFTLFHVRGIRIAVDWSWFLVLFLSSSGCRTSTGTCSGESSSATTPFVLAVLSALGFFGSILLHELGHAVAATRNGIGITSIQLWIFGGMARMDREADSPGTELKVALAGPAGDAGDRRRPHRSAASPPAGRHEFRTPPMLESDSGVSGVLAMVAWLASINLLVLRLQPAAGLPDGRRPGRPRDRLVADRRPHRGDPLRGQPRPRLRLPVHRRRHLMAVTNSILGLFGGVWLALIGMVINGSARGAAMQTAITSRIGDIRVADVMDREPVAIPGEHQHRAGARRVLPPLPLALVPGRRRRPPLPRPARTRPRRRGPRGLPRQLQSSPT